jgi:predicted Rossmann fold nucleotide-binding protein DprA/Smf involved in DNA uptake
MIFGVVGCRRGFGRDFVFHTLDGFSGVSGVVSGGALGVDCFAEAYARARKLPVRVFRPDFSRGYDVSQYFVRNRLIVDSCEHLIAFWDGKSQGTKYTIDYARSQGKPVSIISPDV